MGSNQAGNAPVYFTLPPGGEFELDTHSGSAAPYTLSVSNVVDSYCPDNQRNPGYYDYNAATDTFTPVNDNGNAYVDDNEIIWYYSENLDLWYAYFTPTDAADSQENAITSGGTTTASFITGTVTKLLASRDTLSNNFANADEVNLDVPIYAGTTTGDMVSWNIDGMDNATHVWWAIGPQGQEVDGPEGTEDGAWIFANGGSDVDNQWLTWNPGQWTIYCSVNYDYTFQFTQQVGWRTEDYLVIGQIVNTDTYESSAPSLLETVPFREAVINDISPLSVLLPEYQEVLVAAPLLNSWFGLADGAYWGYSPLNVTPQRPFTSSYPLGIGTVTEGHRFWIIETALNHTIDSPNAPPSIAATDLTGTIDAGQYRILNHYQTRFLVDDNGLIDASSVYNISRVATMGNTKVLIPAGEFSSYFWPNQQYSIWPNEQSALTNPNNGFHLSADGTRVSNYASGQVGIEAKNANRRLLGMDLPWVFAEVIAQINDDGSVSSSVETSVDMTWYDDSSTNGSTTGSAPFNNLNIYKASLNSQTQQINYIQERVLPMLGHLEPYIDTVPYGTWPNPPTVPSAQ